MNTIATTAVIIAAGSLALAGCTEGTRRSPDADSAASAASGPAISAVRVNHGTYGMASRIRWTLSPDSSAILAVVDPAGVENEAVPNAFFFGSESRNFQARMDSVWDVAPSPDWGAIAFSRAYVMHPREQDSVTPAMFQEVARRSGLDTATVRTSSFASSGMSMARALAQPGTITVPSDVRAIGAGDAAAPRMYRAALGWRIRWTADGSLVALGNSPAMVQDDEPSASWASLDPRSGAFHGSLPANARLAEIRWTDGPVLDVSVQIDMQSAAPIGFTRGGKQYAIETARGAITVRDLTVAGGGRVFPIGAGKALSATRGGRYVLALAPRSAQEPYEPSVEAVVYVLGW